MITFYCSHCGTKISAEPSHAGASANCPSCSQDLVVPGSLPQAAVEHAQDAEPAPILPVGSPPPVTGSNSLPAKLGLLYAKLTRKVPKKWAIPGCVLGLILMVSICNRPSKPEKYDVEAAMLEDANRLANGLQSSSRATSGRQCRACDGAGHRGGKGCPTCTVGFGSVGQGTVKTPSGHVIVCSRCQGSGTIPIACGTCGGSGSYR